MHSKIAIVGGGIGGLTAARAMSKKGMDFQVYEGAPSYAHVGGGHWMYGNALKTLDQIDVQIVDEMEAIGHELEGFLFTNHLKQPIVYKSVAPFVREERYAPLVLHRADIINILAKGVPAERLHFGKKLKTAGNGTLIFEDGSQATYDVLIGADGIHSKVRSLVSPHTQPRNSGQVGIWGISRQSLPAEQGSLFLEMWGNGVRVGFTYVGKNLVYWFLVVKSGQLPEGEFDVKQFAVDKAQHFPEDVRAMIKNAEEGSIHVNPLFDLPITNKWFHENTCCLGDAIHACTPNLGQGGCQAIEDGYWLTELLDEHADPETAFALFQKKRFNKARTVVLLSRWLGDLAQSQGGLNTFIRNVSAKTHPRFIVDPVLKWIMTPKAGPFQ